MTELVFRLNCTRCGAFTEYEEDKNSVYCEDCGKKHSHESTFAVNPEKDYPRDEAGNWIRN